MSTNTGAGTGADGAPDRVPDTAPDTPRGREGRVRWRKSAAVAVPAVLAVGAMAVVMAQGALAASFAVSGTSFQVSSSKLSSKGLASYVQTDRSVDGKGHPVALLGIGEATLTDICQSAEVGTPLGTVVFKLTAGGPAGEVTASNLVIDGEDLDGDATFGTAQIGRDASTLDRVDGVKGEPGKFGLQAGDIEVVGVKSHAWSATGGNFRLKGMRVSVGLDGEKCF
ncbi:cholesterol esterase [Streptomyces vinaceus]|nr:cholesterol esterase [Streptomyces vinaceus]